MANRKFYLIIFITIVISFIILNGLLFFYKPLISTAQQPQNFVFISGSSVRTLSWQLQKMGLVKQPELLVIYAKLRGIDRALQAGEYQIDSGMTINDLLNKMVRGEAVHHLFTLVEGWTFNQTLAALNDNSYLEHTIGGLGSDKIMELIGHANEMPEGRFAPDTYMFSGKVRDIDVLNNAYNLMQKRLNEAWQNRDLKVLYNCPYKALIVASLIERETAAEEEKPKIAGVIIRRLTRGMFLDIDASVSYGLGKNKLTRADLAIPSAYNTYLHKELPPTPICMPSVSSIQAAMHPASGNELYYVAKGDGTHVFSNTLEEHNMMVEKWRRQLRIKN